MINPADAIRDGLLRHEIGIRRLSNGTVRKVIAALNDSIPDLERQIRQRLGWIAARGYDASPHTLKRLEANLRELKGVLNEAYKVGFSEAKKDLTGLAKYEGEFTAKMLGSEVAKATGAQVGFGAPSVDLMKAIVETKPFQGRLLRDWAKDLPRDTFTAVRKAVRDGLMQNESIDKIVKRIKGTRALGYSDGVLNQSRRQIENVVRTATAHVTNFARDETYRANSEFIEGVQWVATLDSRTCFPAGTMVLTATGWTSIERIRPGVVVMTHMGRWRSVVATRRKSYSGPMTTVIFGDAEQISATSDHLFASRNGWTQCGDLKDGMNIFATDGHVGDPKHRGRNAVRGEVFGGQADYGQSVDEQASVLSGIPVGSVPVGSVQFDRQRADQEIHGVPSDSHLRGEFDAEPDQAFRESLLWPVGALVPTVAAERAESGGCGWDPSLGDPAGLACEGDGWATAGLATEPSQRVSRPELDPATRAVEIPCFGRLAGSRTVSVPRRVARGDREVLAAAVTALGDPVGGMTQVAGPRAEFVAGAFDGHDFAAMMASQFHEEIISRVETEEGHEVAVYDLQVDEDESFLANGVVVHNCEICAPRDGLRYDLDHRPIGHLVPWGNGPGRLHINDRCTSTPILKTFKKLGIDLPEIQMPGRRVRGQGIVPSSTTYADWIKGQPANVQNNILGINRAQAMRSGKLKFDSMFDDRGRWLNLDQLRAEDAA